MSDTPGPSTPDTAPAPTPAPAAPPRTERRRPRCVICGAVGWCSCGYGPEHGYGRGRDDEP